MPWAKFDDSYPMHDKMLDAGIDGLGFDVAGICYANRYGTDGFIADNRLAAVYPPAPNPKKLAKRLVEIGRWERVEGGYLIHDFLEYQPTADRAKSISQARSAAGKRGAKSRWDGKSHSKSDNNGESKRDGNLPDKPDAPYPVTRTPREKDKDLHLKTAPQIELAERMNAACTRPNIDEAIAVVDALSAHIDRRLIDEAVGYVLQPDFASAPRSPRYFLKVVCDWARQRGVVVPPIEVST